MRATGGGDGDADRNVVQMWRHRRRSRAHHPDRRSPSGYVRTDGGTRICWRLLPGSHARLSCYRRDGREDGGTAPDQVTVSFGTILYSKTTRGGTASDRDVCRRNGRGSRIRGARTRIPSMIRLACSTLPPPQ